MSKGKFYLILSAIFYGIAPLLANVAYRGGVNGITLTFLRSSAAIPVMFAVIKANGYSMNVTLKQFKQIIVLGVFGGVMPILLLYLSYNYISIGLAETLHFIYPIIIVIVSAVIYGEKISRLTLSAVMLVTVGIFMFSDINAAADRAGIVLALLSGVMYSFYVVYLDKSGLDKMNYIVLTFYTMIIMSLSSLIFGIVIGKFSLDISPLSWSISIIISLMINLGAMPLFQVGVRTEGASVAGILSATEPITSVLSGVIFLHEFMNAGQVMGGFMILFGIILIQGKRIKKGRSEIH